MAEKTNISTSHRKLEIVMWWRECGERLCIAPLGTPLRDYHQSSVTAQNQQTKTKEQHMKNEFNQKLEPRNG